MNKYFSWRLFWVVVVTAASLFFVWPTFQYFVMVSGSGDQVTEEERAARKEMMQSRSMMRLGLDLQGGVELLFALDTDTMRQAELERTADNILGEFKADKVNAVVDVRPEDNEIVISDVASADTKIVQEIIEEYRNVVEYDGFDALTRGEPLVLRFRQEYVAGSNQDAVDAAKKVISERVDSYGLTQAIVVKQGESRILVQIPGEQDPERVRQNLLKTAFLEFRLLHPDHQREIQKFVDPATWDDGLGTGKIKPEFMKEIPSPDVPGATITVIDQAKVASMVPAGYELFTGTNTDVENGVLVKTTGLAYLLRDRAELTGRNLRRASEYFDPQDINNQYKVTLEFDAEGTEKFEEVTEDNVGRQFAIVLDGNVESAPVINGPIRYGRCEITGNFQPQDARDLALVLKSGSLPAPLKIISFQEVGASLGQDSIIASGKALMIGAISIIVLMIFMYRASGVIAVLAMLLNVLAILAILSMADATLTLSGIGGILLTMGMAVDANVLIYERLREELDEGKPLRAAMNEAFGRAFTVILDSNITTLLPAIVLLAFEIVQDSVKGFWLALAIGLIVNLYTGLTVTRALLDTYLAKKKTIDRKFLIGNFVPFKNSKFDFMRFRRVTYALSGTLMAVSLLFVIINGPNRGIDFTGGVVTTVESVGSAEIGRADIERAFKEKYDDVKVIGILNTDKFQITIPKTEETTDLQVVRGEVESLLRESFPNQFNVESSQTIEAIVGKEFTWSAFFTVAVAALVILGYLALRFRPVFGLGAVLALVHDVIITFGIFAMLGRSLTLDVVSALLIVLGYSVNDTIVVFDRVREKVGEMYGHSMGEIINRAINETLSRTVFTGGTTLLAILAMLLFGGIGLKDFALILFIGISFGTYSSIFVASALVYSYLTMREKKVGIEKAHQMTKTVKIG